MKGLLSCHDQKSKIPPVNLLTELREAIQLIQRCINTLEKIADVDLTETDGVSVHPPNEASLRLEFNENLFQVKWNNLYCDFGPILPFRLLAYLAKYPNRYITHSELLSQVWHAMRSPGALRSVVTDLRVRLCRAGMSDLAKAVDGHQSGHYGLMLSGQ